MKSNGRLIGHHGNCVDVYFDSWHKIIKSRVEGGCRATLVPEQLDESKIGCAHWKLLPPQQRLIDPTGQPEQFNSGEKKKTPTA